LHVSRFPYFLGIDMMSYYFMVNKDFVKISKLKKIPGSLSAVKGTEMCCDMRWLTVGLHG